jgi:hypothetical protein
VLYQQKFESLVVLAACSKVGRRKLCSRTPVELLAPCAGKHSLRYPKEKERKKREKKKKNN